MSSYLDVKRNFEQQVDLQKKRRKMWLDVEELEEKVTYEYGITFRNCNRKYVPEELSDHRRQVLALKATEEWNNLPFELNEEILQFAYRAADY